MTDGLASVTRICEGAAYRSSSTAEKRSRTATCPYCAGAWLCDVADLQAFFYGMTWAQLQGLKTSFQSPGPSDATVAELARWIGPNAFNDDDDAAATSSKAVLSTITDVLLALYVVSDEPAPPDQLRKLFVDVLDGRLDRLPLPSSGPCFCGSGRRYGKCHRRAH